MKQTRLAAQARARLDNRFKAMEPSVRQSKPVRGWIRAIREALGMTAEQLGKRLGVKQPSVVALEQSEEKGSIELATLRRVAEDGADAFYTGPIADQIVAECGGPITSPLLTIDPVQRHQYEHLEYKPLVNARAHALGQRVAACPCPTPATVAVGTIAAAKIDSIAPYDVVRRMRASVCVIGPLLGRCKEATVSLPGGCVIGDRPIDLHLKGFEALGSAVRVEGGNIKVFAPKLIGAVVNLRGKFGPTVLGTDNVMMAAALADGTTVIEGAAQEPEVVDLANFLNKMGAKIEGAGTRRLIIEGVAELHGAEKLHCLITDSDIYRVCVPQDPNRSPIRYFAPSDPARRQLITYRVLPQIIRTTLYPFLHPTRGRQYRPELKQNH